jgi:hypothetical protein
LALEHQPLDEMLQMNERKLPFTPFLGLLREVEFLVDLQ